MAMPHYAVLQSCYTNKYMNYIRDDGPYKGYVSFTGDTVLSPYAKIAFEKSHIKKDCYHIRCCHSNKYWVRSSSDRGSWVVAKAKEPNEDKLSNENCTLFKVEMGRGDPEKIKMWHEGTGELVCVNESSDRKSGFLYGVRTEVDLDDACYFKWFDCDLLVVLPQHVAFKGPNGRYLQLMPIRGDPYLQFSSTDSEHPSARHEIIPNPDATVRIKSKEAGKYWRSAKEDWIWADANEDSSDIASFKPVKVGPKTILLKMLGKEHFCSRLTIVGDQVDLLNANTRNSLIEAKMAIVELVLHRRIDNVHFRVEDAKISEQKDVVVTTDAEAVNKTDQEITKNVTISFNNIITHKFSHTYSLTLGVETTVKTQIPMLVEGQIKFSADLTVALGWENTEATTELVSQIVQVKVPPKSKVLTRVLGTKGKAEIPYSYTRRDFLYDGTDVPVQMDDGIFTTARHYHLRTVTMPPIKLNGDEPNKTTPLPGTTT